MSKFSVLSIFLFLMACAVAPSQSTANVNEEINAVINGLSTPYQFANRPAKTHALAERMELYHVPGVSIAYFRSGEVVWARGFGVLEAGKPALVDTDTIFQAASISKPVTAMTALSLVEDGALLLDAPVLSLLGDWHIPENPFTNEKTPTLRQLLSHSGGISELVTAGYERGEPLPTLSQMLIGAPPAKNVAVSVNYEPGSKAVYSVGTYLVLQRIIEMVTGQSFSEAARDRVLTPNHMDNSAFYFSGLPADFADDGFARAHTGEGNVFQGGYRIYPELSAAGLWSTPTDLAKMAIEVQSSLTRASKEVLSGNMTAEMLTRQIGNWGLGWEFITKDDPPPSFYHSGSNLGYKSVVYARMDGSEGVAIMTNGENGGDIFFEVLAGMALLYDWTELKPKERVVFDMSSEDIAEFAGEYNFSEPMEGVMIVKAFDDMITVEIPGLIAAREFYPESSTSFFDLGGNILRFEINEEGTPVRLNVGDLIGVRK